MLTRRALIAAALVLASTSSAAPEKRGGDAPWPAEVPGFVAPIAGEHPRLLFRKADLPEIRRRAATPEGQAIVKRLRQLLDGVNGDTFPKIFNASGKAYAGNKPAGDDDAGAKPGGKAGELPTGAYTIGHAAGYGMLYQLTGDQKYADLGRQAFEKAFAGVRDRDDRYSFRVPGGALRAGPALGAYALGYDLCYDGWDPAFRKQVAAEFMKYNEGPHMSLEECARGKRQHPGSNHWGAEIGGPTLVLLGIRGDDGADDKKVDALLKGNADCYIRNMTVGFGDHGFFPEGDGPGTISSDTIFVPGVQAWRVAGGKDFVSPRPNAPWMTMKWVMMTIPAAVEIGAKPPFPIRGGYPHNVWARNGMSGSGAFCQGFGAVTDDQKPALLWFYNQTFKAGDDRAGCPADTTSPYPMRAVFALVNWPIGMEPKNPATVMPKAALDKKWNFAMFRNRWQDKDDIVVTALLKDAKGNGVTKGGDILVLSQGGKQSTFPEKLSGDVKQFSASETGGIVSTATASFAVDFSKASGADALLIMAHAGKEGKGKAGTTAWAVGGRVFTVMTIGTASAAPRVEGDTLVIGGQTIGFDGTKLTLAK